MKDTKKISLLSDFLKNKVKENGWTKRVFAKKTGLNETYSYKLLSAIRHFIPNDETLIKIADVLELSSEERSYILDIVRREREIGEKIYSFESVIEPMSKASEVCLPEPVSLPIEMVLPPSPSEVSSIEVEPVKELKMKDSSSVPLSVISSFLKQKIKDKGLSINNFASGTGISERYIYKLLSAKRDSTPTEETLNKIATVLNFTEEDKKYILDIAVRENESRKIIYSSESVIEPMSKASEVCLPEPVSLPIEMVLPPSPSEASSIEVESVICPLNILEEQIGLFPLSEILIPEQFIKTPPGKWKIKETIAYYKEHGKFDKPIKVNKNTMMLTDGYKRYVAAKELGLTEIQVQFVDKEKQVSTIKKEVIEVIEVIEEHLSKKPVLVEGEEFCPSQVSTIKKPVIEEPSFKKPVLVEEEEFCLLSEIIIPKTFQLPPGKKTIDKAITFYRKHGRFPNSIIINKENKNLIEGYKYYMAAKELGIIGIAVKFIEKEKAKPSDAVKSIEKEKTKSFGLDLCQLSEIIVPEQFIKSSPGREEIEEMISSYRKHGKFDNSIKVIRQIILVDGYKCYSAAKELGLTEIEVKFVAKPVQEIIKSLRKEEKKELRIPTKKKTKPAIPVVVAKNLKGSIKKLFPGKGYGFINGDDMEAYFFHQSGLVGIDIDELDLEYRVIFDLIEGLKGQNAVNIREDVNV